MSTTNPEPVEILRGLAEDFANDLTQRVARILPEALPFEPVVRPPGKSGRGRVAVMPLASSDPITAAEIPVRANRQSLSIFVKYECCWDTGQKFLAIDESIIKVFAEPSTDPLFRVEYLRSGTGTAPASHVQVHAHRDEIVYLMLAGDRGRAGRRAQRDRLARLAELHIPAGGHRFRPCLEDVLQMLIDEFGIQAESDWKAAVEEGRAAFRRLQLRSAVRDSPAEAAAALSELGYEVVAPVPEPPENLHRLAAY